MHAEDKIQESKTFKCNRERYIDLLLLAAVLKHKGSHPWGKPCQS